MSARRKAVGILVACGLVLAGAGCGGSGSPRAHSSSTSRAPLQFPPATRTTKLRPGRPCLPGRDAFYHRSALKCVNGRLRLLST